MSGLTVSLSKTPLNLHPQTLQEEVMQNVRMILSSLIFTVPYDRSFALKGDYLDNPINSNIALAKADIAAAIRQREPRVTVKEVRFEGDALQGKLKPIVRIFINE